MPFIIVQQETIQTNDTQWTECEGIQTWMHPETISTLAPKTPQTCHSSLLQECCICYDEYLWPGMYACKTCRALYCETCLEQIPGNQCAYCRQYTLPWTQQKWWAQRGRRWESREIWRIARSLAIGLLGFSTCMLLPPLYRIFAIVLWYYGITYPQSIQRYGMQYMILVFVVETMYATWNDIRWGWERVASLMSMFMSISVLLNTEMGDLTMQA